MTSQPKVWLITGCSAGFGISLARAVLAHGHHLIASSRNPSKTLELVQEVKQKGGHWLALDVTSPAKNIKRTIDEAVALHGRLDVVVNNAGFAVLGAVEDITYVFPYSVSTGASMITCAAEKRWPAPNSRRMSSAP
jgi:NAD(P)-dependent dehydrogenase (short-subunit alcohol dehydrogenase family)